MKKSYEDTISYLYQLVPAYHKVGEKALKKDLGNIIQLCDRLDNPQTTYPTIHIAGTNGKGSTAHMIAAVLQQAGYKVGLYSSPHYMDFRERIKIDGEMITQEEVMHFVQSQVEHIKEIQPSFFEVTVAMAFDHFSQHEVDIAVIEKGRYLSDRNWAWRQA